MSAIEHIKNLHTKEFNIQCISELRQCGRWKLSDDENYEKINVSESKSDSGMILTSYDENLKFPTAESDVIQLSNLNAAARFILSAYLERSQYKFRNIVPVSILWNYYNKSSDGVEHKDIDFDNFYSIVYYLNDCDGGTYVGNDFYESKAGEAVLFKSNILHRGVGPTKSKSRYMVNLIFRCESYERK